MRPRNGEKVLQGCRFLGLWLGLPSDGLGSRGEEPGAGAGSVDSGGIPGPVGGRVRFRGGRPGAERGWFWRDPVTLAAILLFLSCIALNVSGALCMPGRECVVSTFSSPCWPVGLLPLGRVPPRARAGVRPHRGCRGAGTAVCCRRP